MPRLFRKTGLFPGLAFGLTLICGAAQAQDRATEAGVRAAALAAYGDYCYALLPESAEMFPQPITRYEVSVAYPGVPELGPQVFVIWQILCDAGAYNLSSVFWIEGEYIGLRPLTFAVPTYDIVLEDPANPESAVMDIVPSGWTATDRLVNAGFEAATLTFSHYSKYRGLGDAFEEGTWILAFEQTRIATFNVDASYDGEITPVPLFPLK